MAWVEVIVQTTAGCAIPYGRVIIWIGAPPVPTGPIWIDWFLPTNNSPTLYVCPDQWTSFQLPNGYVDGQFITHYEWDFSCGTVIGANDNGIGMTAQIANGQTFCGDVRVRAVNACGVSGWLIVNTEYTGNCNVFRQNTEVFAHPETSKELTEAYQSGKVFVYPNPTQGVTQVVLPHDALQERYQLSVLDSKGKVLLQTTSEKQREASIDLSALPAGVYQLSIQSSQHTIHKKIVKK